MAEWRIPGESRNWRYVPSVASCTYNHFHHFVRLCPMFFVPGTMGKFIYVIPLTVSLALIVSIVEAIVVLPSHLSSSLKRKSHSQSKTSLWFESLRKSYQHLLINLLRWRYLLILSFLFIFYGVFQIGKNNLNMVLFPSEMAKQFFIIIELPDGSNLEQTTKITKNIKLQLV